MKIIIQQRYIVVDEMDMLLADKAFSKSVLSIMAHFIGIYKSPFGELNQKRQIILACASLKKKIRSIPSKEILEDWFGPLEFVESEKYMRINQNVDHEKLDVSSLGYHEKQVLLKEVIDESQAEKVIVFCKDVLTAEDTCKFLNASDIPTVSFHSNLRPQERIESLNSFETGKAIVFMTTDLACRGVDFKDTDLVVQFNYAQNATNLIHRFGRTGRLNKKGKVTSFVDLEDSLLYE